ncbi:glycosyl transferase [Chlorobaculum tepidum TLS]|uniref:Glycosyl transferase n=2 Tax=Chlorobaculum tepidum TaxID=1097 RepID=Q8KFU5_CHLTE|nr:glycosyl transferase [Chlorobaculum tepidum TLS]
MAARKLSEQHEVSLIYRKEAVGKHFDLPKFRLPCLSHIDLYTLFRMVAIIRQNGIEVVIPTKRKDYLLGGLAGKMTGAAMILRLGADRKLKWPWQRFMYHTLSNGIIVNASKIKKTLLETGYIPEAKIRVIYNGLDIAELDRRRSEQTVAKPFPVTITGLGRLTWNKGYDFLIRSFSRFVEASGNRDAGIVLIGDGAQKKEFAKLADELGLADRVLFPGFQQNPYSWLAASDIFAVTSTNEGLPNALLEAMYLGNAPISTRAGGVEEVIDDGRNGLLLDYGDEEALASALQLLVKSPERRAEFARQATTRIVEQFSMERMASEIASFCREVAAKR